jgi:hypothetical protein
MLEPWTKLARDVAPEPDRKLALMDYPFHAPPSQLREPNRSAANDWLLEHAPWLWQKPRIKMFVSMKTGLCTRYRFEHVPPGTKHLTFVVDRPANQFGVASG